MKGEKKQEQFVRFSRRLTKEGLIKALLIVLTIAFSIMFVIAAVSWFKGANVLWLCIGILAGSVAIGVPTVYSIFYRPTIQSNARRIDRLGLEERMVTMVELENDDSILSRLQREDAQRRLAETDEKQMKFRISTKMIIGASVAVFLGLAMTTLSTLAALGYIMSGLEMMDPLIPDPPVQYVYIEYIVEEGGYIEGDEYQEIVLGESGTEVMAVPEEGWVFDSWTDGKGQPIRLDEVVEQDMVVIAVFVPEEEEDEMGSEGGDQSQDEAGDQPSEQESSHDQNNDDGDPSDEQQPSESGGGKYNPANQIIDGEIYYRDVLGQYDDQMREEMSSSDEIPEDIRDIVESYFEIIG